jgi:deoxycytidylate deaminase
MAIGLNKQLNLVHLKQGNSPVEIDDIKARRTAELVIAFVGPVGSGCSTSAQIISKILKDTYKYDEVVYHRVSELIEESSKNVGQVFDATLIGAERVDRLQDIGNKLREKFFDGYLIAKIVERIASFRLQKGGFSNSAAESLIPEPRRWAHIIDSLKNPSELNLLREVYGDILWVIGVFAPEETRRERLLTNQKWEAPQFRALVEKDNKQEWHYGQGVRDIFFQADFFVRNDGDNDVGLTKTLSRHLDVIFGMPVQTPMVDESSMYAAYAAASRSACMSRQVGAAIVAQNGEVIGIGWNDVPKFGGGMYDHEDGEQDNRCFKWGSKFCHNDARKDSLYRDVYDALKSHLKDNFSFDEALGVLQKTDVKQLIEFSRSVHAEMGALVSVARGHKAGLVGSTVYCTTFPCHSCARHLIAAGVRRVVYIEPYPKSLALELHRDAASVATGDAGKKMVMEQYQGVSPRNLLRLFKQIELKRKGAGGKLVDFLPGKVQPLGSVSVDDFSTHEMRVLARLKELESPSAAV